MLPVDVIVTAPALPLKLEEVAEIPGARDPTVAMLPVELTVTAAELAKPLLTARIPFAKLPWLVMLPVDVTVTVLLEPCSEKELAYIPGALTPCVGTLPA